MFWVKLYHFSLFGVNIYFISCFHLLIHMNDLSKDPPQLKLGSIKAHLNIFNSHLFKLPTLLTFQTTFESVDPTMLLFSLKVGFPLCILCRTSNNEEINEDPITCIGFWIYVLVFVKLFHTFQEICIATSPSVLNFLFYRMWMDKSPSSNWKYHKRSL